MRRRGYWEASEAGFTGFIGFAGLGNCQNRDFCDFCDFCDFDQDGGIVRSRIYRIERSRESEFPPTEESRLETPPRRDIPIKNRG